MSLPRNWKELKQIINKASSRTTSFQEMKYQAQKHSEKDALPAFRAKHHWVIRKDEKICCLQIKPISANPYLTWVCYRLPPIMRGWIRSFKRIILLRISKLAIWTETMINSVRIWTTMSARISRSNSSIRTWTRNSTNLTLSMRPEIIPTKSNKSSMTALSRKWISNVWNLKSKSKL